MKLWAEKREEWNNLIYHKYQLNINPLIPIDEYPVFWDKLPHNTGSSIGEQDNLNDLAYQLGGYPDWPQETSGRLESFMDFSGQEFQGDVWFANILLIGADFRNAVFTGPTDFRDAVFVGVTQFEGAKFSGAKASPSAAHDALFFQGSTFYNTVSFDNVQFPDISRFDNAHFNSAMDCRRSVCGSGSRRGGIIFDDAQFRSQCDFPDSAVEVAAGFENVIFHGGADFTRIGFGDNVSFNGAKFQNRTSFRTAKFDKPPKFFETEIHEDVNFNEIDWSGAEQSYRRRARRDAAPDSILEDVEDAIRAWDRLAFIMGAQEKLPERHEFFRRRMRAQRARDGYWSLSSIANLLFDVLSDYGWGIGRAVLWWVGHILAGAGILTLSANCPKMVWSHLPMVAWNSLLVSISNSLAFLRLGYEGGNLYGPHTALEEAITQATWVFDFVGTVQTILGPILLFLVILTLRNRFRLG